MQLPAHNRDESRKDQWVRPIGKPRSFVNMPSQIEALRTITVLVSGLPGTGKTRLAMGLASRLKIAHLGKDHFQSILRSHQLTGREGPEGYFLAMEVADHLLGFGLSVILDGVSPRKGFRDRVRQMAASHGAEFHAIYCHCSNEGLWRDRLQDRHRYVPHWSPVGWQEVQKISSYYQPWQDGEALIIDACHDYQENLRRAILSLAAN